MRQAMQLISESPKLSESTLGEAERTQGHKDDQGRRPDAEADAGEGAGGRGEARPCEDRDRSVLPPAGEHQEPPGC